MHYFTLQIGLLMVSTVIVVACYKPLALLPTAGMVVILAKLRGFYLRSSRAIKRLEGTAKSPVFSQVNL